MFGVTLTWLVIGLVLFWYIKDIEKEQKGKGKDEV